MMTLKLTVFSVLLVQTLARPEEHGTPVVSGPTYHPAIPAYHPIPAPTYGAPPKVVEIKEPVYPDAVPVYSFKYEVDDDLSYAKYDVEENRDGYVTDGVYRVHLPDGRIQTVKYRSDKNGYVADVSYEGEAKYPEIKKEPVTYGAPAYHAPVYHHPAPFVIPNGYHSTDPNSKAPEEEKPVKSDGA